MPSLVVEISEHSKEDGMRCTRFTLSLTSFSKFFSLAMFKQTHPCRSDSVLTL